MNLNWKRLLITLGFVLLAALSVGGTTWYVMDANQKKEKEQFEKQIRELEEQRDQKATKETTKSTAPTISATDYKFTDEEVLKSLTIRQNGGNGIIAPIVDRKDAVWAVTNPLPVTFSSDKGYEIPARGGVQYLWQKVAGKWTFVGSGGEGGMG